MDITRNTFTRRGALALSAVALTLSVCVAGMPHACADPYDGDDATEVISSDSGYAAPEDAPEDTGAWDQDDRGGQDVADTGDWDQGGGDQGSWDDVAAPEWDQQDTGADVDPEPAPAPAEEAPEPDQAPSAVVDDTPGSDPATVVDDPAPSVPASGSDVYEPSDPFEITDVDTAQVSQDDFDLAQGLPPVEADPQQASSSDVQELAESLESYMTSTSTTTSSTWSSTVTQWNSAWVGYDTYYRPIITNPYRTPLQLVYTYGDATQIVTVAPMQRTVLAVPTPGVYNFTAITQNGSGKPVAVSTGSFSGGGYVPVAGQQPPTEPTSPTSYQNVLVQLHFSTGTSQPFRLKQLTDLGSDPAVGAERVLLDQETPAWGTWSKTQDGERLFEVTKTQQLPGLTAPAEGPLPGYDVQLTAAPAAPAGSTNPLVMTAIGSGVLALVSVAFFVLSGRRRTEDQ